jgi:hypothetical protein
MMLARNPTDLRLPVVSSASFIDARSLIIKISQVDMQSAELLRFDGAGDFFVVIPVQNR